MIYILARLILLLSAYTYTPAPVDLALAEQIDAALPFPAPLYRDVKIRDLPANYLGSTSDNGFGCTGTNRIDPDKEPYGETPIWKVALAHERVHSAQGYACRNHDAGFVADLVAYETLTDLGELDAVRYGLRREFILSYLSLHYQKGNNPTLQGLGLSEQERLYYLSWSRDEVMTRGRLYWSVLAERLLTDDDGMFKTSMGIIDGRDVWAMVQEMAK